MTKPAEGRLELSLRTHDSIRSIGRERWNELCSADESPQLAFEWLDALERTGCVGAERGWLPLHVTLERGEEILAAAPAYLKGNSEGEFVFDHSWARFAEGSLGIDYYPKLVVAVPFTPATGPRLLFRPGVDRTRVVQAFAEGLSLLCEKLPASGAHVLFPDRAQAAEFRDAGLVERYGVQFHWHNRGYSTFDDFLGRFSSKHRNQIRRERREMKDRGIELVALSGRELTPELADSAYEFYVSTVDKFPWGRRYLKRAFFAQPSDESFGDERGFEASLGLGLPLLARADGPWLELRGALEWPNSGEMREKALAVVSFHFFTLSPFARAD